MRYYESDIGEIYQGDSLSVLRAMPDESVNCCVTSPPYWGLRDYGVAGQLGLEPTPDEYVSNMVAVFREVRRVLKDDGTLWLNLGDCYNAYPGNRGTDSKYAGDERDRFEAAFPKGYGLMAKGLKQKDLVGIPWMVAFALRADGWYLRQDIIWHKPNPMPESVRDRCTKAHEYIFLMSKSQRYYYDQDAIKEPDNHTDHRRHVLSGQPSLEPSGGISSPHKGLRKNSGRNGAGRNKRSVWSVTVMPFPAAHFATFPQALIEPCVLAGCPAGGVVLDPFLGSGTTALVAYKHGRKFIGIDLSEKYLCDITVPRIEKETRQMLLPDI